MIHFGPAGNDEAFYAQGNKATTAIPSYLNKLGLDAYEYQCSRGVNVKDETAMLIGEQAKKYGINLSVHSPYYISLSTQDEINKEKTINYIIDTMRVAKIMGATRVVVHAGSLLNLDREYAVDSACALIKRTLEVAQEKDLNMVTICIETMGKTNQLGDSKEIIKMCKVDERLLPTIDFGHLYSRSFGQLNTYEAWKKELQMYINELGYERMKHFHAHMSKMEWTTPGGEKCHVTFETKEWGPDFNAIARVLKDLKLEPTIICESAGTQSMDSLEMKKVYEQLMYD